MSARKFIEASATASAHCPYTGEQRKLPVTEPLPLGWKWGHRALDYKGGKHLKKFAHADVPKTIRAMKGT